MTVTKIPLELLLNTHEMPFAIFDGDLRIVAINKAWELHYGLRTNHVAGMLCCEGSLVCAHKKALDTLKPHQETIHETDEKGNVSLYRVKISPLINIDNKIYLGESRIPLTSNPGFSGETSLIGQSPSFDESLNRMRLAANTDMPVMLNGETGTGKELAAAYIHNNSHRQAENFVVVDCTTLTQELFESELFGHEKGAFTGANTQKKGLFETAHNGTLFLDEIGELPLAQQAKLLRVLETGQYRRVGGTTSMHTNARIISATHRNLATMVKNGEFREDLFYRLSIFPINLPSLKDRHTDIPLLANYFLYRQCLQTGHAYSITPPALLKLKHYNWPGNIRELRNCILLAAGLCQNKSIEENDIHFMHSANKHDTDADLQKPEETNTLANYSEFSLSDQEKEYIKHLLDKHNNHRKACADEMNISERTLYRKLRKYDLS